MIVLPNTDNLIALATLTVSSEDSTYPKGNLAALPISKPFRTTGTSPATAQSVLMDFLAAQSIDLAAIINHNLSEGATITLKAGTTSGVSNFSQSIIWRERTAYALLSTPQNYRYWKIEIDDPLNADGFIEIGYIAIGLSTHYAFGPLYGTLVSTDQFVNTEDETESGTPHPTQRFSRTVLAFDLRLEIGNADLIAALFRALRRNAIPLFIVIDPDIYDGYFGRFWNDMPRKFYRTRVDGYREFSLEFHEDGIAQRVAA